MSSKAFLNQFRGQETQLDRDTVFPRYMNKYKIKKLADQAKYEANEEKLEENNLLRNQLRQAKPAPHDLFMRFFEAFIAEKTEEVNDLLDLVEAYYKPKLAEVQKSISLLEAKEGEQTEEQKEQT